jgi:hypothetical protein
MSSHAQGKHKHTLECMELTHEEGTSMPASKRVVTGDTPEHGKYTIWDSHTEAYAESSGGLAFAIGVAVQEAEITRDASRFWEVCHPNHVALYHVYWVGNGVAVTKIGV